MLLLLPVKGYALDSMPSSFQIDFIDVGQGDSALVQCDGHYMLIDGGDASKSSLVYSFLKSRSIKYIDVIVATHDHEDHVGGLSGALNYANAGAAFSSVAQGDTKSFGNFTKYLATQGKSIYVPKAGDSFYLGSALVTVLGPVMKGSNVNNDSLVLKIIYGSTSFLFVGDAEAEEEMSLIATGMPLKSTVLKVGHHGGDSSTGYQFLREVMPEYAVISVGAGNSYGHPSANVLSRLRDAGTKVFRTDMQGTITCTSNGTAVYFTTAKNYASDTLHGAGAGQNADVEMLFPGGSLIPSQSLPDRSGINAEPVPIADTYVLNTNTKTFHRPGCSSVDDMKEKNKQLFNGTRDEAVLLGYKPCKRCNP